jgi:predicted MPP superfamily phosphohydrolase
MLIFLGLFIIIIACSHIYLFARISYYLNLTYGQRRGVALVFIFFAIVIPLSLPLSRLLPRGFAHVVDWLVYPWLGTLLLMLAVMGLTDLIWFILRLMPSASLHDPERRLMLQRGFGVAALGTTAALSGYSLWNGSRPVIEKPITVTLNRLPQSLDGLRIAQITDLHIGPMIDGVWLRRVVDQVNALKPDLIAVTGDLVDGSVEALSKHVAPLADLTAPLGVYFITGNHEYYSGVEPWCAHVASLGIRVLRNERVAITAGSAGDSFDLVGVDDWGARQFPGEGPDLPKALAGRDPNKVAILMAHQPAAVHEAAEHGIDLQLSGHTHGGQIWPFTYLVYLQQPYVEGLHRHRDSGTQIYVSPGTGFWGPPMRLGTSAEITHITLRSKA